MKKIIINIALLFSTASVFAQEKQDEHLLDGTSLNYYYQNGTAVHIEFFEGQVKFKWIAGPWKGNEGQEKYRSRKIGDKIYLVNWLEGSNSTFVTLIFNFNQNVMCCSALLFPRTDYERILFEGGIIEQLNLKEL